MIKLIIFDLDGVLIETKDLHYNTLNKAICDVAGKKYQITFDEHLSFYDGLKTYEKLRLLTKNKGLDTNLYEKIWELKQFYTKQDIVKITPNSNLCEVFLELKNKKFNIACCSNSIRTTVLTVLSKLNLIEYMDLIISNEDVKNCKPHPEMYWKAISLLGCLPEETLILEDSPTGLLAASRSKSHILRITKPSEVTLEKINKKLFEIKRNPVMSIPKWIDKKLNILIPMAGAGSRFEKAGYIFPKPLVEVNGKPMIQTVIENLNIDANYIYVVQKEHREKYNLDSVLNLLTPDCKIIETEGLTEGAACTTLLAKEFINNDNPLFFANSDQFVEWDSNEFMYKMNESGCDAGIVTFESVHVKWSYAKVNERGFVTEVAEKNPISNIATCGFYWWKKGSDYVKYAEQMIEKNTRVNNEFYVCPVFNEAIIDNKKIKIFMAEKMWGLGTPEDLEYYIKNYKQ